MSKTAVKAPAIDGAQQKDVRRHRRRHERQETRAVVQIYWRDDIGLPCEAVAVVRDISPRGFGIRTDRSFAVGQSITVRTPERSMVCEVRYSQQRSSSYMVGLEIQSSSDGSSLEHSLDSLSSALAGAASPQDKPA